MHDGFFLSLWSALLCGAACMLMTSCKPHGAPLAGIVLEVESPDSPVTQWKTVPVPDAEVLVITSGEIANNFVDSTFRCARARFTRSSADGRFSVAGWQSSERMSGIEVQGPISYAYKAGYEFILPRTGVDFTAVSPPGTHLLRKSDHPPEYATRESTFAAAQGCPLVESDSAPHS